MSVSPRPNLSPISRRIFRASWKLESASLIFAQRSLDFGDAIDAQCLATLILDTAADGERVLVVAQGLIGLVQSFVSGADEVPRSPEAIPGRDEGGHRG